MCGSGVFATTCKCDQGDGCCPSCWENLFEPTHRRTDKVLFEKKDGKYVKCTETFYIVDKTTPKCRDCGVAFNKEKVSYDPPGYGDEDFDPE